MMNNKIISPEIQFNEIAFLYDELMEGVPYNEWINYLHAILDSVSYYPSDILDLCCGTGQVTRILAAEKYTVSGVDISSEMIKVAKTSALEEKYIIDYYIQNVSYLNLPKKFDLVISLFDSLNYIIDKNDLKKCFKQVGKHLNDGGYFIFDINTELALSKGLFNQNNKKSKSPVIYNWKSSYNEEEKLCKIDMDFVYHNIVKKHITHYQRAYATKDIILMLTESGLNTIAVFDAYSFKKINSKSDRAFFISQKI